MSVSDQVLQCPKAKIKLPKAIAFFIQNLISSKPSNRKLCLMVFEPMEIEDWCQIWVPVIYPDISAPLPEDTRRPRGYLMACKNVIVAITQYSESTVENWIYEYRQPPHVLKLYLRSIHILWTMQQCFNFPVDFPKV